MSRRVVVAAAMIAVVVATCGVPGSSAPYGPGTPDPSEGRGWLAPQQALAAELRQESCPTFKDGYWIDVCRGTWWRPGGQHQWGYPPSMLPEVSAKPKAPICPQTGWEAVMVVPAPGEWYWDCTTFATPIPPKTYVVQPQPGQTWGGYHPAAEGAVRPQRSYTVRTGDTVSEIAWRFDTTVQYICRVNPGLDPDWIVVGQTLAVP